MMQTPHCRTVTCHDAHTHVPRGANTTTTTIIIIVIIVITIIPIIIIIIIK